ncbi:MAG: TadE family protein [Actinomycetota bacterium]
MIARYLRRRRDARARGDRGLAMVEMAIVAPFLALIVAGILEYGTLWRDNLTVTSSSRAATRVVSNLGDNHLADYEALLSLNSGLSAIDGYTLEYVMVYDASAADGAPSATCFDGNGDPVPDSGGGCNVYSAADIATVLGLDCSTACDEFPVAADCGSATSLTEDFCPQQDRETDQRNGLTSVGVWVRITRDYFTGIFPGDGVTIEDYSVMKVEPQ